VKLKEVLDRAGVKKDALEVVVDGADTGALARRPISSRVFLCGKRWMNTRSSPLK